MERDDHSDGKCYVALTENNLDVGEVMDKVRSPKAGAIVLFAGKQRICISGVWLT
jgi:molybdopterin synthase catalytic subunit